MGSRRALRSAKEITAGGLGHGASVGFALLFVASALSVQKATALLSLVPGCERDLPGGMGPPTTACYFLG